MARMAGELIMRYLRVHMAFCSSSPNTKSWSLLLSWMSGCACMVKFWWIFRLFLLYPGTLEHQWDLCMGSVFNFLDASIIRKSAFIHTLVSYHNHFCEAEVCFLSRKCSPCFLHLVDDMVHILKVFPYKTVDARILWDNLIFPVRKLIACRGSFYRYIINIGHGDMRDLISKNKGDITMENLGWICVAH